MADDARKRIGDFTKRLEKTILSVSKRDQLQAIGLEAIRIIVKRTRLGYGAPRGKAGSVERFKLPPLSKRYREFRATTGNSFLSEFAAVNKSNLTFTGQMLDSMNIIKYDKAGIIIGPTGARSDPFSKGVSNEDVANYVAKQGRTFNNITIPEAKQLIRFFRNVFGDLLKNERI